MNDIELKEKFKELTRDIPYLRKAIFPSELFMFYREALRVNADHIIESGIGNGGSTAYLERLFPNVQITSIDRGKVELTRSLHPNIEFIQGDGRWEVAKAVHNSKSNSIAVLIDGPKGNQAIMLAKRLLMFYDNVKIVAIHDLQSDKISPIYIQRDWLLKRISAFLDNAFANSHDSEFRELAGDLDAKTGSALQKYPNGPGLSIYKC